MGKGDTYFKAQNEMTALLVFVFIIVLRHPLFLVIRYFALRGLKTALSITVSCWRALTEFMEYINIYIIYRQRFTLLFIPRKILIPERGNTFKCACYIRNY